MLKKAVKIILLFILIVIFLVGGLVWFLSEDKYPKEVYSYKSSKGYILIIKVRDLWETYDTAYFEILKEKEIIVNTTSIDYIYIEEFSQSNTYSFKSFIKKNYIFYEENAQNKSSLMMKRKRDGKVLFTFDQNTEEIDINRW